VYTTIMHEAFDILTNSQVSDVYMVDSFPKKDDLNTRLHFF